MVFHEQLYQLYLYLYHTGDKLSPFRATRPIIVAGNGDDALAVSLWYAYVLGVGAETIVDVIVVVVASACVVVI